MAKLRRISLVLATPGEDFGFRISFGFRPSDFGFPSTFDLRPSTFESGFRAAGSVLDVSAIFGRLDRLPLSAQQSSELANVPNGEFVSRYEVGQHRLRGTAKDAA